MDKFLECKNLIFCGNLLDHLFGALLVGIAEKHLREGREGNHPKELSYTLAVKFVKDIVQ